MCGDSLKGADREKNFYNVGENHLLQETKNVSGPVVCPTDCTNLIGPDWSTSNFSLFRLKSLKGGGKTLPVIVI